MGSHATAVIGLQTPLRCVHTESHRRTPIRVPVPPIPIDNPSLNSPFEERKPHFGFDESNKISGEGQFAESEKPQQFAVSCETMQKCSVQYTQKDSNLQPSVP